MKVLLTLFLVFLLQLAYCEEAKRRQTPEICTVEGLRRQFNGKGSEVFRKWGDLLDDNVEVFFGSQKPVIEGKKNVMRYIQKLATKVDEVSWFMTSIPLVRMEDNVCAIHLASAITTKDSHCLFTGRGSVKLEFTKNGLISKWDEVPEFTASLSRMKECEEELEEILAVEEDE